MTPLAQRIREIRRHFGDTERGAFAEDLGSTKSTIAFYERGQRTPDASVLELYRDRFGVDLNWLVTGEGEMFGADKAVRRWAVSVDPTDLDQPGMIAIPRYDEVRPSAGPGAVALSEAPTTRVAFEKHWLIDLGVQADAAVILPAQGDSMSPTIPNGAPMLVDTSKKEVRNGFIYVFDIDGDLVVKRIERLPDGTFDLISDNRNYPTRNLSRSSVGNMTVVGRVYAAVNKF